MREKPVERDIDEQVIAIVERMWPSEEDRRYVFGVLADYGKAPHERETARVQTAILKLTEGRRDRLADLVTSAKRDYRDVLMWAEYPDEGRALWTASSQLSASQRKRLGGIRTRDREQYLAWLADVRREESLVGGTPVLVLPGLYNSGPDHWQSRWETANPEFRRVRQDDWERPRCADWVVRLDAAVRATPDAVLVAHSSSCALVAHWAGAAGSARVRGALLVAPSDPEAASYPQGPAGFAPMPLDPLPFPSVVVASTNDPYVTLDRARTFADGWGRSRDRRRCGHLNGESGLGDWPAGFALLQELRRPVTE
jgi:predicted alpha/beta hydrolase family esterase